MRRRRAASTSNRSSKCLRAGTSGRAENTDGWRDAMCRVILEEDWRQHLREGTEQSAQYFSWQALRSGDDTRVPQGASYRGAKYLPHSKRCLRSYHFASPLRKNPQLDHCSFPSASQSNCLHVSGLVSWISQRFASCPEHAGIVIFRSMIQEKADKFLCPDSVSLSSM